MKRLLTRASLLTAILVCQGAEAQVGTNPMSLGMSPPALGAGVPSMPTMQAGPNALVGPVGVPLGSTELPVPGLSPAPTPLLDCSTTALPGSQTGTTPFDGGGLGTSAQGTCPQLGDSGDATSQNGTMPGMPALNSGRTGIPLGSTEIANPGLSPPPPPTTLFAPAQTSPSMGGTPGGGMGGNP
jgi:hypothetical protein